MIQDLHNLSHVVAVTKTERGWSQDVAACLGAGFTLDCEGADQLIKGLGGSPVFLLLIRWQFDCHHRDRQSQCPSQTTGIVLNQFGGAGRTNQQGLRLEALVGFFRSVLEQLCRVAAKIAGLERGVGDRRPF